MQRDTLQWLVAPESAEAFRKEIWGKTPKLFKASPQRRAELHELFTTDTFNTILNEVPLTFGADVLTARYRNGVRERPTPSICDTASLWELFGAQCTLQFLQPQRFLPDLRRICVALESEMECLVGCNAYMTPKNTQGLAPHHDDVELFICQTQGAKRWKLYAPVNGFFLPNASSDDLSQEAIGKPILEVTLEVGDVLYMPKGIVHQALAQETDSVHLTLSTYQRWTWGDLTASLLQDTLLAESEPVCLPVSLREGLPLGFLSQTGRYTGDTKSRHAAAQALGKRLRDLAAAVEEKPEMVQRAIDLMAYSFMTARMPPDDDQLPLQEQYPRLEDVIQVTGKNYSRLMPVLTEQGKEDETHIQVLSCFINDPQAHMMQLDDSSTPAAVVEASEDGSLVLDLSKSAALIQIFNRGLSGIVVQNLDLPSDREKLELSGYLWEHGIVQILDQAPEPITHIPKSPSLAQQ